jgi:F-type H+-transporting ATPase subunit delta
VTNRTAAIRYARALFDVSLKEKLDLSGVAGQIEDFANLFSTQPTLAKVLLNPAVPTPRKRAAVEALVESARPLSVVSKLLVLLAERDRLVLLPDLAAAYRDRLLDHQKVVRAEVATATPLSAGRAKAIEKSVAQVTGKSVTLSTRVAPEIIGGLIVRVGGTVYDASVTRQLERMKRKLEAGG